MERGQLSRAPDDDAQHHVLQRVTVAAAAKQQPLARPGNVPASVPVDIYVNRR